VRNRGADGINEADREGASIEQRDAAIANPTSLTSITQMNITKYLLPGPFAIFAIILPLTCVWAQTNPPADVTISGIGTDVDFGWQVAPAGDVNGDGFTDFIVGDPSNSSVAQFAGRAYLFLGPLTSDIDTSKAVATISAEAFGDNLGISVASAGDVNGDGFDDILIGARSNDDNGIQSGRVYLFYGPVSGSLAATTADAIIEGAAFDEIGRAVPIPSLARSRERSLPRMLTRSSLDPTRTNSACRWRAETSMATAQPIWSWAHRNSRPARTVTPPSTSAREEKNQKSGLRLVQRATRLLSHQTEAASVFG
jgi:hypothetical protein